MLIRQTDAEEKSDGVLIVNWVEMELGLRNPSPTFPKTIYMWPIDLEVKDLTILEEKRRGYFMILEIGTQ